MRKLKERLERWPIAKKISGAIVFLIALPMFALLLTISVEAYHAIVRQTVDNTVNSVLTFSSNAQTIFEVGTSVSKYVTANDQVQKSLRLFRGEVGLKERLDTGKFLAAYFDRTIEADGLIAAIAVITNGGDVFASRNVDVSAVPVEDCVRVAGQAGKGDWFVQSNAFIRGLPKDARLISRVQIIRDANSGAAIGYVLTSVPENLFFDRFSQMQYGESSFIGIVDMGGAVISASNADYEKTGLDEDAVRFLHSGDKYDYQRKLSVKQSVGIKDWYVYAEIPIRDIFFNNTRILATFFIAGTLFLALISLLSTVIMRCIAKPIRTLADQMEQVGEGDLQSRVSFGGQDEIGRLSETFNRMTEKLGRLMDDIVADQVRNRELQFAVLQSQIKPHFLYNTLEGICALIVTEREEDAYDTAKNLGLLYRSMLSRDDDIVTIREELKICRYYLDIQRIRYKDKLRYTVRVDERIGDAKIARLTLQPLIENAIYHGLKEDKDGGEIVIEGGFCEGGILISVKDDGVGMDPARAMEEKEHHFGLYSVNERIKLNFGADYGLTIHSRIGEGTQVHVFLPDGRDGNV